jgi:FlaG/FlaF family flagellin (archaellin)
LHAFLWVGIAACIAVIAVVALAFLQAAPASVIAGRLMRNKKPVPE